jgi:hypothetical protein
MESKDSVKYQFYLSFLPTVRGGRKAIHLEHESTLLEILRHLVDIRYFPLHSASLEC